MHEKLERLLEEIQSKFDAANAHESSREREMAFCSLIGHIEGTLITVLNEVPRETSR